jgi:CBS domain-containing protein
MTAQVITIAPDALLSDAFHCFHARRISMLVVEQ